jgi:hypothetical protein
MINRTQTKLDKMIRAFSKLKKPEDIEHMGKKLWTFSLNYRLELLGHLNSSEAIKKQINIETTNIALEWDTDDASLAVVQKIMNRLARGDYIGAVKLAESNLHYKEKNYQNTVTTNNQKIAKDKHASNNKQKTKALAYYKDKRHLFSSKEDAALELEKRFPPIKKSTYRKLLRGV